MSRVPHGGHGVMEVRAYRLYCGCLLVILAHGNTHVHTNLHKHTLTLVAMYTDIHTHTQMSASSGINHEPTTIATSTTTNSN